MEGISKCCEAEAYCDNEWGMTCKKCWRPCSLLKERPMTDGEAELASGLDKYFKECDEKESITEIYTKQMAENHAFLIEKNFWMVVKEKPNWMPVWLYKAVIKNLIEFQQHK